MANAPFRYRQFLLGAAAGIALCFIIGTHYLRAQPPQPAQSKPGPVASLPMPAGLLDEEENTIDIFQRAAASVVFITNKTRRTDFFTLNVMEIPQGSGSGFLWDNKGHVVTNYHVIEDASALTVTLSDQTSLEAEVVGAEPAKDLAVLRINAPANKLKPLTVGNSADLRVGQKVLAIGNPFGLDQSLTVGVVSALGRQIQSTTDRTIRDVIQTDTAINPGNSGGPLIDSSGRLIGVNTAILSPSGAYAGVGFAVPVNTVKRIVPQLIQHGKIIRPGLGVELLPDSIAERLDIEGVLIARVTRNSSAAEAGIKGLGQDALGRTTLGDVIVAVNDQRVRNVDEFSNELERYRIGDVVTLTLLRDDKEVKVQVRLQQLD